MENYVTTMRRWGDSDTHSYIVYIGPDKDEAIKQGNEEKEYRGGKYEPEVILWKKNRKSDKESFSYEIIKECG